MVLTNSPPVISMDEPKPLRVLVIDDEEPIRHMLSILLKKEGYNVRLASNGEEALKDLMVNAYDLVLSDVRMPKLGGLELLDELEKREIESTVIMMSAFGNRDIAIQAIKRGAYDYIDKPFQKDEILLVMAKAVERLHLKRENEHLRRGITDDPFVEIVGRSDKMKRVLDTIAKVAPYGSTILVSGESGTGKELVAKAIHRLSPRAEGPWIPLNCGAIPENLLESELFGHVRGAFTDAHGDKKGLFQEAHGGTIFLDEVAELSPALQVKLLRVLQEGEIRRLGDTKTIPVDVRVIAATLRDLSDRVKEGLFREDLYYRLNVIQIHVPPLRDRPEDIHDLVEHFITIQNRKLGTKIRGIDAEAMKTMVEYEWPGNVRELQNCIERGVVLSQGDKIDVSLLPERIRESKDELAQIFHGEELSIKKLAAALERVLIKRALEKTQGNRTSASKLLEISHRALLYKIKDYGLEDH